MRALLNRLTSVTLTTSLLLIGGLSHAQNVLLIATPKEAVVSDEQVSQNNGSLLGLLPTDVQVEKIETTEAEVDNTIASLMATGRYAAVERDVIITPTGTLTPRRVDPYIINQTNFPDGVRPNDPGFQLQTYWGDRTESRPFDIGVLRAWQNVQYKQKTRIAIIDGGFLTEGQTEELTPVDNISMVKREEGGSLNEYDFRSQPGDSAYNSEEELVCEDGHGIAVASVAVAKSNNDLGMAGILDPQETEAVFIQSMICGTGVLSEAATGIRWAAGGEIDGIRTIDEPVDVINLSLGAEASCTTFMQSAIDFARSQGAIVVTAAGNGNINVDGHAPANCEGVIRVGANKDTSGDLTSFSNHGNLTISSMGDGVLALMKPEEGVSESLGIWTGTSFAAPQVSALLAMAGASAPSLDDGILINLLSDTALKMNEGEKCIAQGCGPGMMRADEFIAAAMGVGAGEMGTIRSAISDGKMCDKTLYMMVDSVKTRLCENLSVNLTNTLDPSIEDVTARLLVSPAFDTLTLDNATVVAQSADMRFTISNANIENVEFGYQLCFEGTCQNTIYPVTLDTESLTLCSSN